MGKRYKLVTTSVTMTSADTEYSWIIPEGAREPEIKLNDAAVAWRWSTKSGEVASGGGHPMTAGSALNDFGVEHSKQTIYFACSSAGKIAKIACNVPFYR